MFLVLVGKYLTYLSVSSSNDEVARVMNTAARARSAIICFAGAAIKAGKVKDSSSTSAKPGPTPPTNLLYHRSNLDFG